MSTLAAEIRMLREEQATNEGQQATNRLLEQILIALNALAQHGGETENIKPNNKAGRRPVFDRELLLEALWLEYDGGIQSRAQLKQHLENWASTHWPKPPDIKTIERTVAAVADKLNLT